MIRAFAALALPDPVRLELALLQHGLPLPRVVPPESLHLTLVFLGELPEPVIDDVDLAFRAVTAARFELTLSGLGLFGGAKPRAAYAGVAPSPALARLQAKVETAARTAGVPLAGRRFTPHVTLARLPPRFPDGGRLEQAIALRGAWTAPRFAVDDYRLYRSHLGGEGPVYEELARYPLG